MVLDENPVADKGHRRAHRQLAVELDCERVHRDDSDDAARLPGDAYLGPGHVSPEAVRVPDRDDPDPSRLLRDEAATVAGAISGCKPAYLREVAVPAQHGLQSVGAGVFAERGEPVDSDPAAGGVEVRFREA